MKSDANPLYKLSLDAEDDLDGIWEYIAEDSPVSATRFVDKLLTQCEILGQNPLIGRLRPELSDKPLRSWTVGQHVIFYRADMKPISVIRVVRGTMDLPQVFGVSSEQE